MTQKVYSDLEHPYELDVKQELLNSPELFGNLGESRVISEKSISEFNVIADLLIFSTNKGVIGVEIKTEHDSTHRLNKQLRAYESVCTEVWVIVHDSLYKDVEKVLDANNHPSVGIISYNVVDKQFYFGKIRDTTVSDQFDVYHLMMILWKSELLHIARYVGANRSVKVGNSDELVVTGFYGDKRDGKNSSVTGRATKKQLAMFIKNKMGTLGAYQLIVDMFVNEVKSPEKVLKYYHFTYKPVESVYKVEEVIRDRKTKRIK